jgi:hypothetical protein
MIEYGYLQVNRMSPKKNSSPKAYRIGGLTSQHLTRFDHRQDCRRALVQYQGLAEADIDQQLALTSLVLRFRALFRSQSNTEDPQ